MSDYEARTGKIKRCLPLEGETYEQQCKRLWIEAGKSEDSYDEDGLYYYLDSKKYMKMVVNKIPQIWELLEQNKIDTEDSYCHITENSDGTYNFSTHYYNGGTCMEEMIEDELCRMNRTLNINTLTNESNNN